jgi:outer membrane protein assembly factor BamA
MTKLLSKIFRVAIVGFVILAPLFASAQDDAPLPSEVKRGWNFGPLPAIGYNSDLGFQLGALCDIYYYGDGSVYPGYVHKFNIEASYYFKGSGVFHFFYDSKYLIPKVRLTTAITYLPNPIMNFYGFNGAASPYNPSLDKNEGMAFYSMKRNSLRVLADFSGNIKGHLNWAAGMAFWNYRMGEVSLKKYAENASYSLYNIYRDYGVIGADEAAGGSHFELKAGLVYDTRDHEAAPSRGIWAEAMIYGSPDMFQGAGFNYLKATAHFRHYVPVWEDRIVFAYHLAYQGTVAGRVPFYLQSNITTPYLRQVNSEGLGSVNTLRGMLYNRIVGDGVAWGNAEVRIRLVRFNFISQAWYVALNPFFDAGKVVQPYRLDEMKAAASMMNNDPSTASFANLVYSGQNEKLHMSAGLGVKLAMNRNFIVSVEWAKPFDSQDGTNGMNVGLNYIF